MNTLGNVTAYLASTGWLPPEQIGERGGLWRDRQSESLLPVPNDLDRHGADWIAVTEQIAHARGIPVDQVIRGIERQSIDVVELRAANDIAIRGSISYQAGAALVESGLRMLRSSATTAERQRARIGNYSRTGDELVATARMAHTRDGSYVIPILLPISDPVADVDIEDDPQEPIDGMGISEPPEPPERRVMRTFAEALSTLDAVAIAPEQEPKGSVDIELVRAGVSSQFASALHRILVQETVAEFSAEFEWAPAGGPAPRVASAIVIPSAASERVGNVANRLKKHTTTRAEQQFVGPILGVVRDHDADTGTVRVEVIQNRRPTSVLVNVSAEILDQAWTWAQDRRTVVVNSKVRRTHNGLQAVKNDAIMPLMLDVDRS
ncbi:hypothetical protein [Gordonia sihwensis]|uniref:hypothetical protein n=1 Tax=Gordonia sihwensis TaxID=173559 RepID=UPI002415D39A|nr:hypothetical protein [Gordonia sihwensis]WFN93804.1 hypothetical protein P5P27_04395 [Gordonia sihwensis]